MNRRVSFHTFGCKLNQYETESLASAFRTAGFAVGSGTEPADVYVVNTCTVTTRADHKARSLIRALMRAAPDAAIVVTGCSAQTEVDALSALSPRVVVVPQSDKSRLLRLPGLLVEAVNDDASPAAVARASLGAQSAARWGASDPFALTVDDYSFHTRAFLKVQDGCDCVCAYCRVPLARGRSVSLGLEEVLRRARGLETAGRREIVLTGVNVSAWRSDGLGLSGLLRRLLESTTRARYRITSLEPESLTADLVDALADPRICPHFHIPVQSGSDKVLSLMRRKYRSEKVREGVRRLREKRDDPFIAADILVGFPGETEDDFARTRALVEELRLAALHVFPFSPRPGTPAADMRPSVPERARRERAAELGSLSARLHEQYAARWKGREVDLLLEGLPGGRRHGVSGNYLKAIVSGVPSGEDAAGAMVRAVLVEARPSIRAQFLSFC